MALVLDFETSGKSANENRIVQIGAVIVDREFNTRSPYLNVIVRPVGFNIPKVCSDIHGITTADALARGIPLADALTQLMAMARQCTHLIAHNIKFDYAFLVAELGRAGMLDDLAYVRGMTQICTMKSTARLVNAKDKLGRNKDPNLGELHKYATGGTMEGAHDAECDVRGTCQAMCALVAQGKYGAGEWLDPPSPDSVTGSSFSSEDGMEEKQNSVTDMLLFDMCDGAAEIINIINTPTVVEDFENNVGCDEEKWIQLEG